MGGFRLSVRNVAQVTGVTSLGVGWALNKVANLDAVVIALLVVGVACLGVAVWQRLRFRTVTKERTVLAQRLKWRLVAKHGGYVERFRGFPFGQGRAQEAQLVAFGAYGDTFGAAFTYEFTRGSGRFEHIQEYDVVLLELPVVLPDAYLLPRDSVETAKALAGFDRSTFELVAFNDRWSVTGRDKKFVHALVHPLLIESLMRSTAKVAPICLSSGALYVWTAKRLNASESIELLDLLDTVRRTIPDFVWKDYAGAKNGRLVSIYGQGDHLTQLRMEES
jgi:hypothetical protein